MGIAGGLYQALPPYQQREGIRLVIADVEISEEALEVSIHGKPASEAVLEKLRASGIHFPRRSETSIWLRTQSVRRTVLRSESENFKMVSGRNLFERRRLRGPRPVALKSATPGR